LVGCGGPDSGMGFQDQASRLLKTAWAGVIAEAGPELEDAIEGGAGDRVQVGEFGHPAQVIGGDGGYLGLLQHRLGEPDCVGIGCATPGEVAGLTAEVTEESAAHFTRPGRQLARCRASALWSGCGHEPCGHGLWMGATRLAVKHCHSIP